MPNINIWMSALDKDKDWVDDIENDNRAYNLADRLIQAKPYSITLSRNGTPLSTAQTVRVETTRIEPYETVGDGGRGNKANIIVLGYRGHPDTNKPDFDVKAGDSFMFDGIKYRIRQVYTQNAGITEAWGDIWA